MKKGLTHIVFVFDKSGSMLSLKSDSIGSFNSFIQEQKKVEGECKITLVLFDTDFNVVYENIPIQNAAELNESTYVPGGSTSLFDTMGKSIKMTRKYIKNLPEEERTVKVIFAVLTNGEENASRLLNKEGIRKYTKETIFEKVSKLQEEDGYGFVFLGANQDAFQVGTSLGFYGNNTVTYTANSKGMNSVMDTVSCFAANFRTSDDSKSYARRVDLEHLYQDFEVKNSTVDTPPEDTTVDKDNN